MDEKKRVDGVGRQGHEDQEGHEGRGRLRVPSPLSAEIEDLMYRTIGVAITVHKRLGPGYFESAYRDAMCVELSAQGMPFERERAVVIRYRGVALPRQRVDLIVANCIVVELKSVMQLHDIHRSQLISSLRATGLRAGLLINFRVCSLRFGIKRVVL